MLFIRATACGSVRTRALGLATALPGAVAADADVQHLAQVGQRGYWALRIDQAYFTAHPSQSTPSLFNISTCIFSRAFSARSLDNSICSGVTGLAPAPRACQHQPPSPSCAASARPSPVPLTPRRCPWLGVLDGLFPLNSAVYSCFGIFTSLPSGLDTQPSTLGRRKRQAAQLLPSLPSSTSCRRSAGVSPTAQGPSARD